MDYRRDRRFVSVSSLKSDSWFVSKNYASDGYLVTKA